MAFLPVVAVPSVMASTHPVHAQHAIVVSVHELASHAGVEIMQAGGNAIDAAVATGFALAVVHPAAGNIGGGGFMLVRMADGTTHFLDYREKAPAAATRDMYLDAQGNVIEGASEIGYKSIGVPGSVAGMVFAEQKYGKLTLKQVMGPAIRLAHKICMTGIWLSSRSPGAYFSATVITTRQERSSVNPIWRVPCSASRRSLMISIMARSRGNWRRPCRRAEG